MLQPRSADGLEWQMHWEEVGVRVRSISVESIHALGHGHWCRRTTLSSRAKMQRSKPNPPQAPTSQVVRATIRIHIHILYKYIRLCSLESTVSDLFIQLQQKMAEVGVDL